MTTFLAVFAAGVIPLSVLSASAAAFGGTLAEGPATTIEIKGNNEGKLRFEAPATVDSGDSLEVVNSTDPFGVGPHTFSLVEKSELPQGKRKLKKCSRFKLICGDIAEAHQFDPDSGEFGEVSVENGVLGWDERFDGSFPGDSWYSDAEGAFEQRTVSASPGKLWFMCIIHPQMQDKIEVLAAKG